VEEEDLRESANQACTGKLALEWRANDGVDKLIGSAVYISQVLLVWSLFNVAS